MKAEKTLKLWSIITLSISFVLTFSLFWTLFAAISVGNFLVEFYEGFTNDLGAHHAGMLYRLFFQIELFSLTFMIITNQVLMWIRSSTLKKNCKCCESTEKTTKKNKKEEKKTTKKEKETKEVAHEEDETRKKRKKSKK